MNKKIPKTLDFFSAMIGLRIKWTTFSGNRKEKVQDDQMEMTFNY